MLMVHSVITIVTVKLVTDTNILKVHSVIGTVEARCWVYSEYLLETGGKWKNLKGKSWCGFSGHKSDGRKTTGVPRCYATEIWSFNLTVVVHELGMALESIFLCEKQ